ncbi:MAG: hypothetical protein AAFP84_20460 [Actinomycetota bacterium]
MSLVYFAGQFSHAFRKTPADGDFRVNGGHGGTSAFEAHPDGSLVDFDDGAGSRFADAILNSAARR